MILACVACSGGGSGSNPPPATPTPVPAALAVRTAPLAEQVGLLFAPVVVEVRTDTGVLAQTDEGRSVTIAAVGGTGALTGSKVATTHGGVAVFDRLVYDQIERLSLKIDAAGLASATTPPFPVSAGPAAAVPIALASVTSAGGQGNGASEPNGSNGGGGPPSLSGDGRFVAYYSLSSNLVSGDTNAVRDTFVRDVVLGETTRVTVGPTGAQLTADCYAPSLSADGRFVAFLCEDSSFYVRDRQTGATELLGNGAEGALSLAISANGRYVAHRTRFGRVAVSDRMTGTKRVVDISSTGADANAPTSSNVGADAPAISSDGRYVAFSSAASNLVPGDTNGAHDVFVHDRDADGNGIFDETGGFSTERVSIAPAGGQVQGASDGVAISADGRYVAFGASTSVALSLYLRDRLAGTTTLVSRAADGGAASGAAWGPAISADGRFVAFASYVANLVTPALPGAIPQVFVWDRSTDGLAVVSKSASGVVADGAASNYAGPAISGDGRYVAFPSAATNLVSGDVNGVPDTFVAPNPLFP
jgi:Tol biopolymer transport system component